MSADIEQRKIEHLLLALRPDVQGPKSTWFEFVEFVHSAVPQSSLGDVSTETEFLGKKLEAPLIISGMTGGTRKALEINRILAEAAEELRIAIGVGSQRPMIEKPHDQDVIESYKIVRRVARSVPVIGNIGFAQLLTRSLDEIEAAVSILEADALAVHFNVLQELAQPEGDRMFSGVLDKLSELRSRLRIPIIVKEIGFGLSFEVVSKLFNTGIRIFDVAGSGGTNWLAVELLRRKTRNDVSHLKGLFEPFLSWGIPTAASIVEARAVSEDIVVIGSGGIRSGLDIAKAVALGADLAGLAAPMLSAAMMGNVKIYLRTLLQQLRIAMVLTGSKTIQDLKRASIVVRGLLAEWICARRLLASDGYRQQKNIYLCCRSEGSGH